MDRKSVRYHNRFEWWSVKDCDCKWCLHYRGKKRGCSLDECCCDDIRQEAIRREQLANKAVTTRSEVA